MGNTQKKGPGHGEGGGPHSQPGTPGHKRSHGNNTANSKEVQGKNPAVNGTLTAGKSQDEPQGSGPAHRGTAGASCNLDAPCGALPPPLARLKNEGNLLFKNGQFGDALEKYTQAIDGCLEAGRVQYFVLVLAVKTRQDICVKRVDITVFGLTKIVHFWYGSYFGKVVIVFLVHRCKNTAF